MKIIHIILLAFVVYLICLHYSDIEYFDDKFGFNKINKFKIKSELDGKCLTNFYSGSSAEFDNGVNMTDCNNNNQKAIWKIDDVGRIVSVADGKCLDRHASNVGLPFGNDVWVVTRPCTDQQSHKWNIDDQHRIVNQLENNTYKCLDRYPAGTSMHAVMRACTDQPSHKWLAIPVDDQGNEITAIINPPSNTTETSPIESTPMDNPDEAAETSGLSIGVYIMAGLFGLLFLIIVLGMAFGKKGNNETYYSNDEYSNN